MRINTKSRAAWLAVGVAAAVVAAVLVLAGMERVPEGEPASASPGEEVGTTVSASGAADATSTTAARGPLESPSEAKSDPDASAGTTSDSAVDTDLAVEIVEPIDSDLGTPVGGAVQETPVEPGEPDGPAPESGDPSSAQGDTYTWQDGDRVLGAQLQLDLVVTADGSIVPRDEVVAQSDGSARGALPVFRSESGELMTLPGGVILVLDSEWDSDEVDGFFASHGISLGRVSELDYLPNGFVVDTEPGFPSLDLANALAGQAGVELSSPNWRRERTTQ
nr:hypothetical protein [bacterium]